MIDIRDRLLPNENVQYQFAHPLWLKLLAVAALVVVGYMLYEDVRAARYLFVVIEVVMVFYIGTWLRQMLLDTGQYFVTDQRVMRISGSGGSGGGSGSRSRSEPEDVQALGYGEISEVRLTRDTVSGVAFVVLRTADDRSLRVPTPSMGKSKAEDLVDMINRNRGIEKEAQ